MKIKVNCDFCGSVFYRYRCELKKNKHLHFCNRICYKAYTQKYGSWNKGLDKDDKRLKWQMRGIENE